MMTGNIADDFAVRNLPPKEDWPEFIFDHPAYQYPDHLNCVSVFVDQWMARGHGEKTAFYAPAGNWTYQDLSNRVNQLAHVLVDDMGLIPGNRVLLRSANNPMMVACYMAVMKAGGIAVGTMPLLRATELATVINKAEISHVLCDRRLESALKEAKADTPSLKHIGLFNAETGSDELEALMATKPTQFEACNTRADDICLIAFTSGTTGPPKGTIHFHRDLLTICNGFSALILKPTQDDIFCGSPPLAFTFGLGGMALFSLHVGAATLLLELASPTQLLEGIDKYKATICFTAPTAYRVMLRLIKDYNVSSLTKGVSAGEHLPLATYLAVEEQMGIKLIDGLGSTEMLHVFITSAGDQIRPGATGIPLPGYKAAILDNDGNEVPYGTIGLLAIKGPVGCRYLADERQKTYVKNGWNMTGDAYRQDEFGYFWFEARADDMIISAGYNISGPEVENALLAHEIVSECAVIGVPDDDRGMIVKAFIVLNDVNHTKTLLEQELKDYVKAKIAPYKYPREIEFVDSLPKTETGKLQRFKLREAT